MARDWRFYRTLSVKDFGAVGDGVTDDSAAFIAARNAWKALIRTNLAPGADSNKLGAYPIYIPNGSYLITSNQVFLDSTFTTRTVGMLWQGDENGGTQILYEPTSAGPLVYNNDAVLTLRFENISFVSNSSASDFIYSNSSGGSQDYGFTDCSWSGSWQYGVHLVGTNNNSEMFWDKCAISGSWTSFLFGDTSDQFLNYWFDQCKVDNITGIFVRMLHGGHVKINECDFSGHSPTSPSVLFSLEGTSHSAGICSFVDRGSRYELKNANAKVMYSQWPQGIVRFDGSDFSSQVGGAWAPTLVTHDFQWGNTPGPQVIFDNCNLMGLHNYVSGNSAYFATKAARYVNCDNTNFPDFYSMFTSSLDTGGNLGSLPAISVRDCRGNQGNWGGFAGWAASTAYTVGQQVRSGAWLYTCTVAGTSGTQQPYGAGAVTDGSVTWTSSTTFMGSDFVTDGSVNAHRTRNVKRARKQVILRGVDGNWPARLNATTPGAVRAVLPPNAILTGITLNLPAGLLSQGTTGSFKVLTDQASPTTFLNFTSSGNLSAGFTQTWSGYYNCGSALDARAIVFMAMTDVTQFAGHPAVCILEYLCGE